MCPYDKDEHFQLNKQGHNSEIMNFELWPLHYGKIIVQESQNDWKRPRNKNKFVNLIIIGIAKFKLYLCILSNTLVKLKSLYGT